MLVYFRESVQHAQAAAEGGDLSEWIPTMVGVAGLVAVCGGLAGGAAAICHSGKKAKGSKGEPKPEEIPIQVLGANAPLENPGDAASRNSSEVLGVDQWVVEHEGEVILGWVLVLYLILKSLQYWTRKGSQDTPLSQTLEEV